MSLRAVALVALGVFAGCATRIQTPAWSKLVWLEGNGMCLQPCRTTWTVDHSAPGQVAVVLERDGSNRCATVQMSPGDWSDFIGIVDSTVFFKGMRDGFACEGDVTDGFAFLSLETQDGRTFSRNVVWCSTDSLGGPGPNQPRSLREMLGRNSGTEGDYDVCHNETSGSESNPDGLDAPEQTSLSDVPSAPDLDEPPSDSSTADVVACLPEEYGHRTQPWPVDKSCPEGWFLWTDGINDDLGDGKCHKRCKTSDDCTDPLTPHCTIQGLFNGGDWTCNAGVLLCRCKATNDCPATVL